MKKMVWLVLFFISTSLPCAYSEEKIATVKQPLPAEIKKPMTEDIFSVSTEDMNSSDSLNRVAGDYDRGYSSPEQSYHSDDHGPAGPFAREKSAMASEKKS